MAVRSALVLRGGDPLSTAVLGNGGRQLRMTALWTAVRYRIPLLMVVANHRPFHNDEVDQARAARRRNRPEANRWIGQRLTDPVPDIAGLARAQAAEGFGPVAEAAALPGVLAEALAAIRAGRVALADMHIPAE